MARSDKAAKEAYETLALEELREKGIRWSTLKAGMEFRGPDGESYIVQRNGNAQITYTMRLSSGYELKGCRLGWKRFLIALHCTRKELVEAP